MKLEFECDSTDVKHELVILAIKEILEGNSLLTLATEGAGHPSACALFFAFSEEIDLYVLTDVDSQHVQNTQVNPQVAATIFESRQSWGPGDLKGVQAEGVYQRAEGRELIDAWSIYSRRFPEAQRYFNGPEDLVGQNAESGLYIVELQSIKLLYERHFGLERFLRMRLIRS